MNTAKNIIFRGHTRTIEDVVETWKCDHYEAMEACGIEDVVKVCIELVQIQKEWQDELWKAAYSGKLQRPIQAGADLAKAHEKAIEILQIVQEGVDWAQAKGYVIERVSDFLESKQQVNRMKDDFLRSWPSFSQEDIEAAKAKFAQGKYQPVEDILSELQGLNS
jgi:hypothetical protein